MIQYFSQLKLFPMVSTDTTQLNRECSSWREQLRSYRNEMSQLRDQLQLMASGEKDKDVLTEVEHYHNQFYIQQINIHDLKQAIKSHDRRLQMEELRPAGQLSPETIQEHEELHDQYEVLEHTLNELRSEFMHFMAKA
jgi:chromosome segregation ATPase